MASATAKYVIRLEDKTKRAFKAIGNSMKKVTKAIFSMKTGLISAAGIAGLGYLIKRSLDATDEMAKMSRAIGVSVEELQALRHAAALGGLQSTQLDKAVQKLAINMADMSRGVGLAKDIFEEHNISVKNADGSLRSVIDVMTDVADVTAGMTNATEKADLAYKLFGARGAKMINMLNGGGDAMHAAMKEAEKLGLVMSAETAEGVEKANDAMTRLGAFLTSSFRQSIAYVAPLIETITNSLRDWFEMKITASGGVGKLALEMAHSFVVAGETILLTFQEMANGVMNFIADVTEAWPEWLGGVDKAERKTIDFFDAIWNLKKMSAGLINQIHQLEAANLAASAAIDAGAVSVEEQTRSYKDLNTSLVELIPNYELVGRHMEKNNALADDGTGVWSKMKDGFEAYFNSVSKGTLSIASITEGVMKTAEDAIVNMMMGVKTNWKSLFKAILADIIRLQVRKAAVSILGGIFGFANGGRPPTNRPSIVGEKGAELFVPDSAGTIVPNNQLGGGGNTTAEINFNVQAIDASSFNSYLVNNRDTIESIINNSITTNGSVRRTIQMAG
jgi:hypothetical protein